MMADPETKPAVRLRVWHRHGVRACGGVLFIVRRRFTPGEVIFAADIELPSGRVPMDGEALRCDACGAEIPIDTGLQEDFQDAGAYPTLSHTVDGRAYHTYSGDLDDDLALSEGDEP